MLLEKLITLFRRPQTPNEAGIKHNRWFSKRTPKSESQSTLVLIAHVRYIIHEAFWSFFYIWFGFLYAQVSFGTCKTMESWKCAILSLKPLSHIKILIYRTWAIYCRGYRDSTMERSRLKMFTHWIRDVSHGILPWSHQPTEQWVFLQWICSRLKQCFFFRCDKCFCFNL